MVTWFDKRPEIWLCLPYPSDFDFDFDFENPLPNEIEEPVVNVLGACRLVIYLISQAGG